ncbi:unnamed protein product [Schistosoma spindalis]|nr:unnamed protein product [Schistosoma spindale]
MTDDNNDENYFPTKISTTIPPKRNMFMFFEVSPRSFHQVAEVFSHSKRLSLHGWFHGPSLWTVDNNNIMPSVEKISPIHIEEELVYQWINPVYFDTEQLRKIRRKFCRSSEIQLTNFIKTDKWIELVQCLKGISVHNWLHCGPPNRRNYHCLFNTDLNTIPDICTQIIRLFKSEAMLVILSDITGIQLHPCNLINDIHNNTVVNDNNITDENAPQSKRMRTEDTVNLISTSDADQDCLPYLTEPCLRKLQPGSYTLLSDADMTDQGWRLDCLLHIHGYGLKYHHNNSNNNETQLHGKNPQSNSSWSGQTVYVADGEEDELLTVTPSDNSLTLVYAGPGTTSFLKYINHTTNHFLPEKNQIIKQDDCNPLTTPDKLSCSNTDHMNKDPIQLFDLLIKYFESKSDPEDVNSLQSVNKNEVSSISSQSEEESFMSSLDGDSDLQNDEDEEVKVIK